MNEGKKRYCQFAQMKGLQGHDSDTGQLQLCLKKSVNKTLLTDLNVGELFHMLAFLLWLK